MENEKRHQTILAIRKKLDAEVPKVRHWLMVPLSVLCADLENLSNESLAALESMLDDELVRYYSLAEWFGR